MKLIFNTVLIVLLACNFAVYSQETNKILKRSYTTKTISASDAPKIDGVLDDQGWNVVNWTSDFIENQPDENTTPSEQTSFKIIYDDKFIYIGVRCHDSEPQKIIKRLSRRDGFEGDWIEFNIDSYNDKRTAFSFNLTAAGVKGDEFVSNDGNNWDSSWNPIWYGKTQIDKKGWTAEFKIPFSQLRFGKNETQVWGLQVTRRFFRKEERSLWQRVPREAPGWVSSFGELHGLKNLKAQKQLEIQPYTVAQLETYPAEEGNPFRDGSDTKLTGGLDAKIGITNDLTLDLTVNPDFGQVEADPAAIALDGFQIFFREQRPFFIENKNIFDYQFAGGSDNLFYSRRIGRSPQGNVDSAENEFVDQPDNTNILGAAKFSGKTKNGWSIGVLETITGKEFAKIDNGVSRREEQVEPLTNYFVGRVQKDFNKRNTYVGGIFTATNRDLTENLSFLRESAYSGGLDFKHNWKDRKYFLLGNFVVSSVNGTKEAITNTQNSITHLFQRVDASHVNVDENKTNLTGTGGKVVFGKAAGRFTYTVGSHWYSPELELNDIGFLRQADDIQQYVNMRYRFTKPFGKFRYAQIRINQFSNYDFEGNFNRLRFEVRGDMQLKSNWEFGSGLIYKPRIYSNTTLRGGPRFRFSDETIGYVYLNSDRRKKLNFGGEVVVSQAKQNHFSFFEISGGITYQPLNALQISLRPRFSLTPTKTQYITDQSFENQTRYITGHIDQQTLSTSIRLNYTINPNLSIQYYGEPFVSRGRYTNFNYITNPIANDLNDRFELFDQNQISFDESEDVYRVDDDSDGIEDYAIENPDFSFVQFRSNLVLRWEYIPGSELFFVWSQGTTGIGDANNDLFRNLDNQILKQKPENIFLIKATYRFML